VTLIGTLKAGSNTLEFLGLSQLTDQTAFIENVNVAAVPETSTWAMMILGFVTLDFWGYRGRNKLAPGGAGTDWLEPTGSARSFRCRNGVRH
jgi:hypothetical protein